MTAGGSKGPPEGGHYEKQIRIGISACLLGEKVRYDGGHKLAQFLIDAFGGSVEWVSVCPEVEAGFGTPREPMQLTRIEGAIGLTMVADGRDVTASMNQFIRVRLPELRDENLSGYILKANSPSCGIEGVKVHDRQGVVREAARGLFAEALIREFPDLPVEDESRLSDPRLLAEFVKRVFSYRRSSA